jgi:hypothetical protein
MSYNTSQWKSVPLSNILQPDQMTVAEAIFKRAIEQHQSEQQLIGHLKDYLKTIEPQLREKGLLPDYLAYVLLARAKGVA